MFLLLSVACIHNQGLIMFLLIRTNVIFQTTTRHHSLTILFVSGWLPTFISILLLNIWLTTAQSLKLDSVVYTDD